MQLKIFVYLSQNMWNSTDVFGINGGDFRTQKNFNKLSSRIGKSIQKNINYIRIRALFTSLNIFLLVKNKVCMRDKNGNFNFRL